MRIGQLKLAIPVAVAAALGSIGCQTARPTALLPNKQASAPPLTASAAPPTAPVAEAKPVSVAPVQTPDPKPDPVVDLIAQVEKEYQSGQDDYKAGHLEAAKQDFDRAFNLLLESPLEIRADERLQREFDHLLDGVNSLELEALQQGDGFTEQKSEPAPIDEANEVTYPVDPGIKAKAEAEVKETHSDLPLMLTDPVASYINYFSTRGRGTLESALARGGRYREMIESILKQEGVPQDLIYLAQAESGFHPLAVSRAGARGMWQFMASRARGYGLERDWWVDERQNPEKATRAAARHLKDLYNQFGDWYLAMAAYNSGPGTVQNAVKRTGYADYWELYKRNVLPKETRNYVPIILAVTIMAKNPMQYGLEDVVPEKPVPYDTVKINYPVDLRLVAECVDSSAGTLQDLNPSLLRWTTPKNQQFELHLPTGTKERYLSAISAVPPDMRVWWRYHTVAPGDTLASVARAYRTSARVIAQANGIDEEEQLSAESKLIIPVAPGKHPSSEDGATYSRRATRYTVRKGDTVQTVADNFGVPAATVRRWNHVKGDSLRGRHVLYIHLPVAPNANPETRSAAKSKSKKNLDQTVASRAVRHTVQRGETLYSIAKSHNTTVAALKQSNGNLATLRPGMILVITPPER
ncbi:MAG TPA: LysM peptidoglycan-binding domain-containing protein [Terriglobales bacterium]|nr:LysM peptidoglycan-binding domain-containing protein [Terriglobales bacterium]